MKKLFPILLAGSIAALAVVLARRDNPEDQSPEPPWAPVGPS